MRPSNKYGFFWSHCILKVRNFWSVKNNHQNSHYQREQIKNETADNREKWFLCKIVNVSKIKNETVECSRNRSNWKSWISTILGHLSEASKLKLCDLTVPCSHLLVIKNSHHQREQINNETVKYRKKWISCKIINVSK